MTPERWNYIKSLSPDAPLVVWASDRRGTFNDGRNAKKRATRDFLRRQRVASVARLTPTNCRGPSLYALPKRKGYA